MCHVTTQIEGRPDDDLLSQKGFRGFPSLAILDAEGEILKKDIGRTVEAMNTAVDAVSEYNSLKQKIASGAKGLEAKLFVAEVRLGKIDVAEAEAKLAKFKLTGDDKKLVDSLIFDKEFSDWLDQARSRKLAAPEFFGKVLKAYKAGRRPSEGGEAAPMFWQFLLQGAEDAADPKAFEAAAKIQIEQMKKELDGRLESIRRKAKAKK